MKEFSREELAAYIEGLADPHTAGEIERTMAEDEELRREVERLRRVLPNGLQLPETPVPPGLRELILARIEEAGLVASEEVEVPAGLRRSTLARLEVEGLLQPAALPGRRRRTLVAVASLLLAACVGGVVGFSLRTPETVVVRQTVERPVEKVVTEVRTVEKPVEKIVEKEVVVEKPVTKEVIVEKEVEPRPLELDGAEAAEVWSPETSAWKTVEASSRLRPGDILRGTKGGAWLSVGAKRLRLGSALFVVTLSRSIEPVPCLSIEFASVERTMRSREEEGGAKDEVPALIRMWSSGSREDRARAQQRLRLLWEKLGDPRAGRLQELPIFAAMGSQNGRGPPETATDWQDWWQSVRGEKDAEEGRREKRR